MQTASCRGSSSRSNGMRNYYRPVALQNKTVATTRVPSWMEPTAHRPLVGYPDQRESHQERAQMGLVCFPSEALLMHDPTRLSSEQLFLCLPTHVAFDPYYQAGLELGKF